VPTGPSSAAPSELVVGVDVATAEVRVVAADGQGRLHGEARCELPEPTSPQDGWFEQDAGSWWSATTGALRQLSGSLGGARRSVRALSVCSTSGTVVALDSRGRPLGPALTYADQRAVSEAERARDAARERWHALGLTVQPSFGLPKWAWLLSQPEVAERAARLAHASDVVVERLVGAPVPTDWSHALKSGYDVERREWVGDALDALGIRRELLPEVRRPTEPAGEIGPGISEETGLPEGCEVRLGMTDACASQVAAGAASPGRFVSVLGSTLVLKGVARRLVVDPGGAVYSHRHPDGWWLPGGASSTGGKALAAWFSGRDLADLDSRAEARGPARAVTYPLVGRGERFPFSAPDATGFSLGDPDDEVERYRAVLEGVGFLERLGYDRLAALGAEAQPPIATSGGSSRSRVWSRIRASVLARPVVAKASATTSLGACILAAAGTLHADLETATRAMAPEGEQVDPEESWVGALDANYGRFLQALDERGWHPSERERAG
jgi:sugar (pentulose or hexulose) kinase